MLIPSQCARQVSHTGRAHWSQNPRGGITFRGAGALNARGGLTFRLSLTLVENPACLIKPLMQGIILQTTKSLEIITFQRILSFLLFLDRFRIQGIWSFLLFLDTFRIQKCLETVKRQNPLK